MDRKFIKIGRAKQLDNSIGMFTNIESIKTLMEHDWYLQTNDGSVHPRSQELLDNLNQLLKSRSIIDEILTEE